MPDSADQNPVLLTPERYEISPQELHGADVVLVFNPAGDAHVYVKTGLSPASVLELVLDFAHNTVVQHFGTTGPGPDRAPETVIDA